MKKTLQKGFTLIELLIVIAILAILAVGLIAALNPVEQTSRASDQSRRTLATELANAFNRFYAVQQYSAACPAGTAGGASTCAFTDSLTNTSAGAAAVSGLTTLNTNMNTVGESRTATTFTANPQAANVYVAMSIASGA